MKNKLIAGYFMFFMSILAFGCDGQTVKQKNKNQVPETSIDSKQTNKKMNSITIDVRTPNEWQNDGHADCSVNIPLDQLASKIEELKAYDKIVVVCRSGARAGSAKNMLEGAGIKQVENLGPWQNVNCN
jgi:rhodanese-related sulfurtransferase